MISATFNGPLVLLLPAQIVEANRVASNDVAQQDTPQRRIIEAAAAAYKLYANQELIRSPNPVLRFDDTVTLSQHGSVYLWTDSRSRPLAIASFYFQADGARVDEFQSLSTVDSLRAEYEGQIVWNPKAIGIEFQSLEDEHEVPSAKERRLGVMRTIARRFTASVMDRRAGRLELRLLPQPLYRYGDEEKDVVDGALFSYAKGTNPEVLLVLEARAEGPVRKWRYALARMSARGCNATLDGTEIWALPAVGYKQDSDQPYFNRYTR